MENKDSYLRDSTPLVTIIVPCFNYGWILSETLDSLVAQVYTNWECIIIDDGSTDSTRSVAESYQAKDSRFIYAYQVNSGLSAARNHGLRLAKGNYIQFLDADDLLVSTKLYNQVAYLESNPQVDIIYGDVRYFRHGAPNVFSRSLTMDDTQWMVGAQGKGEELLLVLIKRNIMVVTAPLLRATLLKKVKPFTEDLRSMEDWDFWMRCALAGACFHYNDSPNDWSLVRVHPSSMSQDITKMFRYEIIARQRLQKSLEKQKLNSVAELNRAGINDLIDIITELARRNVSEGNLKVGIKDYLYLAKTTNKRLRYTRGMLYWFRMRLFKSLY